MSEQKPTVGRIVHFYRHAPGTNEGAAFDGPFAAIIAAVYSETCCTLSVMEPHSATLYVGSSCQRKDAAVGMSAYWEWPPRD